jgi:hypothetical protein
MSRGSSCGLASTTSAMPRVQVPRHIARLVEQLVVDYFSNTVRLGASAHRAACCRLLRLHCVRVPRHIAQLVIDNFASCGSSSTTSPTPCIRVPRHVTRLVVDYFTYAARPGPSAHRAARRRQLHLAWLVVNYFSSPGSSSTTAPHAARRRLLLLRRASGCLGTSRGLSSTTSPTTRILVPWHVARLVIDYFAYTVRPSASAHHTACRAAHRRLLRLRLASGCLGMSRGSSSTTSPRPTRRPLLRLHHAIGSLGTSRGSSSTTLPMLRVRVPCLVARLIERLVVDYSASPGSSSTTSPTSCDRVPRHVTWLDVGYFAFAARPGASVPRTARRRPRVVLPLYFSTVGRTGSRRAPGRSVSRLDYTVRCRSTSCPVTLALLQPRCGSRLPVSRQHRLYFEYAAHHRGIVFRPHRINYSS